MASGLATELLDGGSSRLPNEVTSSDSMLKKDGKNKSGRGIIAMNRVLQEAPFSSLAAIGTKLS